MKGPSFGRILMVLVCLLAGCSHPAEGDPAAPPAVPGDQQRSLREPRLFRAPSPLRGLAWGRSADAPAVDAGTSPPLTDAAPAPVPAPDAGPPAMAPPPGDPALASLGPLPAELSALAWPAAPRIAREVTVTSAAQLAAEARVAGTRIHVRGAVGGGASIAADDVEILADPATSIGTLSVARGVSRVRVQGGRYAAIRLEIPATFYPTVEYRPEWLVQDVLIERVTVDAGAETAFEIRGRRVAIVDSDVTAGRYGLWCGDTAHFTSEDVILFRNVFRSAGPEATVRLVSVVRSATVGNTLANGNKHNYRIHGTSDLNYASRNLLVNTGVMLGRMPGDALNRVWFDDNVFHHTAPDLFNPDAGIRVLRARRNLAYTDVRSALYSGPVSPGWELADNVVLPYRPPPAY